MDNAELINSLKDAEMYMIYVAPSCYASCEAIKAIRTAADLIEAQAKRIEELNTKCADLQSQINSMENEIEELMPKESEWMKNIRWYYQHQTQSTTTNVGTTFLCRSTGKPCPNATEYGYCKQTVCNNSGEWMKGKQE